MALPAKTSPFLVIQNLGGWVQPRPNFLLSIRAVQTSCTLKYSAIHLNPSHYMINENLSDKNEGRLWAPVARFTLPHKVLSLGLTNYHARYVGRNRIWRN